MPNKSKPPSKATQAQKRADQNTIKKLTADQKAAIKHYEKLRRDQARERDRILVQTLKSAAGKGIYDPKSFKLTKYRRAQARKIQREFGDFLNPSKYFFVQPEKKQRAKFKERATNLTMKTTKAGAFIAKEGHTSAKVKYDAKRDELYIQRSGKTKRGPRKGLKYKSVIPLASIDTLDGERDRIIHLAKRLGPLGPKDRLSIKVVENGVEGYSAQAFSSIELLLAHLDKYQKSIPAKVQFFRHIIIEKTTATEHFAFIKARNAARDATRTRNKSRLKKLGE